MFRYYMPTEIYFGENCLLRDGLTLTKYGKKAMIVTGSSSARMSGALADMEKILSDASQEYSIFSEIQENPELKTIHKGSEKFIGDKCDYIIGIGGGSPVDAAKAISVVAANHLQGDEMYNPHLIKEAYPIIAVPTTSGTGTEATPYSVITSGEKKAGFGTPLIFPKLSFLDPKYTLTMPEKVTLHTGIDALSHLLEGLYSNKRCPLVYPMIFSGIKIIFTILSKAVAEPGNYEYRKQMMVASLYGGMVIAQTSTTLQHSIGYPLTTEKNLSHGMANGIVMKHIMELYYPSLKTEIDLLFRHLGCSKEDFYVWLDDLGMSKPLNLETEFIAKAAAQIKNSRNMALNPIEVSVQQIEDILAKL